MNTPEYIVSHCVSLLCMCRWMEQEILAGLLPLYPASKCRPSPPSENWDLCLNHCTQVNNSTAQQEFQTWTTQRVAQVAGLLWLKKSFLKTFWSRFDHKFIYFHLHYCKLQQIFTKKWDVRSIQCRFTIIRSRYTSYCGTKEQVSHISSTAADSGTPHSHVVCTENRSWENHCKVGQAVVVLAHR